MSRLKFKPEIFQGTYGHYQYEVLNMFADIAQKHHDQWLSEQKRVYTNNPKLGWQTDWKEDASVVASHATYTAILCCVEPIEKPKCEKHEPEVNAFNLFRCRHCKIAIAPKWEPITVEGE